MIKTIITTDSGSNPRNNENMIPCIIIDSDGNSYYDMKKIIADDIPVLTNHEAFNKAIKGERLKTAAPNINDFITIMTPYLEKNYNIVHLAMSSGISAGSVNGAKVAADMLNDEYGKRVTVIDTLTGGSGGTIINDYAEDLLKKGLSTTEIINELENVKHYIFTSFYISKVGGFVKSGRAPKEAIISDKLSLRYRIDINDKGRLYPKLPPFHGNIRSQFMKYLRTIINESNKLQYNPNYFSLLITKLKEININEIKEYLYSLNYFDEKVINELEFSGVISSYGVEDQVGIGLIKNKTF